MAAAEAPATRRRPGVDAFVRDAKMRAAIGVLLLLVAPAGCAAEPRDGAGEAAQAGVLHVGPGRKLERPSDAAEVARDGDTIEIDAGVYAGDAAVWHQNRLTIRGAGGRAHIKADGASVEGKGIWVIKGNATTVESLEFSGATVPDRNGAGIRLEGAGLTVRDCYFHDNESGILTGVNDASDVVIEHSEFAHNWIADGNAHNFYIGNIRSFTLLYSYVHHAVVGHNVKSRAKLNVIAYNRIMDEKDGSSSYSVEFPNGGVAFVIGNLIQQGPRTENPAIVSYGAEGTKYALNELYLVNNTVVNDYAAGGRFVVVKGADVVKIVNNVFSGGGELLTGRGELRNNVVAPKSDFVDARNFDYRLKPGAAAIGRGVDPGGVRGFELRPTSEYVHKAKARPRPGSGNLDAGALAYTPGP